MLEINWDDVIKLTKLCIPYLIFFGVILVVALVVIIACKKLQKHKKFMVRSQSGIAIILALIITVNLICFIPMSTMLTLATGGGTIEEETTQIAEELCEDITEEGIVLLKNEDGVLPLGDKKINVFGWASTNPCYGGTGSGALSGVYPTVTLLEGLETAGFELNKGLSDFYTAFRDTRPVVGMWEQDWTLPEPTVDKYTTEMIDSAKTFSDKAVIVITRVGGEGADLPTDLSKVTFNHNSESYKDFEDGEHYLELTKTEEDMIDMVCSNFNEVVLVYNSANTFELGFVDEYEQIKSVIWCPGTGQTGFRALGSVMSGAANPSAKTTDIFVRDLTTTPYFNNFGAFQYDNVDEFKVMVEGEESKPTFVNYVENIYVGYRFYETAAKEGIIDYDSTVLYPFGHGLSYTTFKQEMGELETDSEGNFSVNVTVTNTGNSAGKEVVELYYTPPYKNGGIEKSEVNLLAFGKTDLLEAGQSQTITLTFKGEDMASYDTYKEGAWVLEDGDYVISTRSNSHTVLSEKVYNVPSIIIYKGDNKRSTDQVEAKNQFDFAEGEVNYLSRKDGFSNYNEAVKAPAIMSMSDTTKEVFFNDTNYDPNNYNNENDVMPVTGAKNGMKLADMRGKDYADPSWETLLDQLSVKEMVSLIAYGGYQTQAVKSVGKVITTDCDGPASINNNFTGVGSIGMPSAVTLANSWNEKLAMQFGEIIGKMAAEMEVSGWYAPAMNNHRTAFSGRNFEYYSEDGLLAGKMSANAILGAEKHGVYAYMKHFALNDQETNRTNMLATWSSEQAIREIYLKPFEIAVKEGKTKAVMSAFNYIGSQWAGGCDALLNTVLRDEWGFRGMVLTDYFVGGGYMDADQGIRNGNDICLVAYDAGGNILTDSTSETSINAMRTASKNIFYTTVNSRAYGEDAANTGLRTWQIIAISVDVLLAAGVVALEIIIIRSYMKKRKEHEEMSATN